MKNQNNPCSHDLMNLKLGYIQHHYWMDEQMKKGNIPTQCKDCGLWLFPCEVKRKERG